MYQTEFHYLTDKQECFPRVYQEFLCFMVVVRISYRTVYNMTNIFQVAHILPIYLTFWRVKKQLNIGTNKSIYHIERSKRALTSSSLRYKTFFLLIHH